MIVIEAQSYGLLLIYILASILSHLVNKKTIIMTTHLGYCAGLANDDKRLTLWM